MRADRVTSKDRQRVLELDRKCFLFRLDRTHVCRDAMGRPHSPYTLELLTLDHVHDEAGGMKGKRAPSDPAHMVAMCHAGNVGVPSRDVREAERAYLHSRRR